MAGVAALLEDSSELLVPEYDVKKFGQSSIPLGIGRGVTESHLSSCKQH